MNHRLDEKLHLASSAYESGNSCVQAVLTAYAEELKLSAEEFQQMAEHTGSGIGSSAERCGVIAAASAIAERMYAGAAAEPDSEAVCPYPDRIEKIFRREYGGTACREILKGCDPASACCEMKVKDMILIIEQITGGIDSNNEN